MDDQRLSEWKALVESTEDPVDRSNLENQMLREWPAPYIPAEYDSQDLEMWHRVLSASIQSPPSVVEGPVRRNLIEPQWLREVYGARARTLGVFFCQAARNHNWNSRPAFRPLRAGTRQRPDQMT